VSHFLLKSSILKLEHICTLNTVKKVRLLNVNFDINVINYVLNTLRVARLILEYSVYRVRVWGQNTGLPKCVI
jgi:hypothetical protein